MNAKTLKALRSSIAHWRRMATGRALPGEVPYGSQCALCNIFLSQACRGCPVMKKTMNCSCGNTPFCYALQAFQRGGLSSSEFQMYATDELKFLKSLLPKKKKR